MSLAQNRRLRWFGLILWGLAFPVVIGGAWQAFRNSHNNVSQWLPRDFPETRAYELFLHRFGNEDEAGIVSWDGCTLDDPRLTQLAARLTPTSPEDDDPLRRWFGPLLTGPQAVDLLMSPPSQLSRREAIERLTGTLIGDDCHTTCLVITLSADGKAQRLAALRAIEQAALEATGLSREQLHLGGNAFGSAAIDLESTRAIRQQLPLATVLALVVAWVCLRSFKVIGYLVLVALYAAAFGTSLIYLLGATMNLVLVILPVLVYVLTLSACVHLVNYYRDAQSHASAADVTRQVMRLGWKPCALSVVTTSLGLISLAVSHVEPIRHFGIYATLGMLASLVFQFSLLPLLLTLSPPAPQRPRRETSRAGDVPWALRRLAIGVLRRRGAVMAVCSVLLLASVFGIARLESSVKPLRFFSPQTLWYRDALWIENQLAYLIPIEVMLQIPAHAPLTFLERMELAETTADTIRSLDYVGGTLSAATFALPESPAAQRNAPKFGTPNRDDWLQRSVLNKRLLRHRDELVGQRYLYYDEHGEYWRISARVQGLNDLSYAQIVERMRHQVEPFLQRRVVAEADVKVSFTGTVPLLDLAQHELLSGLILSFCTAFLLIGLVLIYLLRSVPAGLLAMLPNIFPAAIVFGAMGWLGSKIDIGAMMTASVALGIAVDDTLHFLTWFQHAIQQGKSRRAAIREAYQRCAPAMLTTTLIAGVGVGLFAYSDFQPVAQFGLLMGLLLATALAGDLIFLPALLASPAGRYFSRSRCPHSARNESYNLNFQEPP